jgi:hypothetical protein
MFWLDDTEESNNKMKKHVVEVKDTIQPNMKKTSTPPHVAARSAATPSPAIADRKETPSGKNVAKKSSKAPAKGKETAPAPVQNNDSLTSAASSEFSGTTYDDSDDDDDDDDSDVLDLDDTFDDFDDIELMGYESNPIVGNWVDSACGWLDKPMCMLTFGKDTSLLRQSKGRTKAAIQQIRMSDALSTVANMKLSAAERRNLRLHRKGLKKAMNDGASTIQEEESPDVTDKMKEPPFFTKNHIQPSKKSEDSKGNNDDKKESSAAAKKEKTEKSNVSMKEKKEDSKRSDDPSFVHVERKSAASEVKIVKEKQLKEIGKKPAKIAKEKQLKEIGKEPAGSNHSRKVLEDNNESMQEELSQTLDNVLKDSPIPARGVSVESHEPIDKSEDVPELPLKMEEKPVKKTKEISSLSERTGFRSVRKNKIMQVVQKRSRSVPRTREAPITDLTDVDTETADRVVPTSVKKLEIQKSIEIIDVLSMDEEDSWTPGTDPEPSTVEKSLGNQDGHSQVAKSRDPSPSISNARDPSPVHIRQNGKAATQNVDDIWNQEVVKLKKKHKNEKTRRMSNSIPLPAASPNNVWKEEEQKLQKKSDTIFDDPKAREAFLDHRRGRLVDNSLEDNQRSRSHSRRRQLVEALQDDDSSINSGSRRSSRSRSLDLRFPPSPELQADVKKSRSKSRERPISTPVDTEDEIMGNFPRNHHHQRVNKANDLVVIRTIEDAQRLRSSVASNSHEPIDVHEYMLEKSSSRSRHEHGGSSHGRLQSRDLTVVNLVDTENNNSSRFRDERDDSESRPENRASNRGSSKTGEWPDYETVISATKQLRKLEKKIEKQLRQTKHDDAWENQTISSKEIKQLEKQLAKRLKHENEKRATKLKRIKRKVPKSISSSNLNSGFVESENHKQVGRTAASTLKTMIMEEDEFIGANNRTGTMPTASTSPKTFSEKVEDFREKSSKFDQLKSLRSSSRYRRGSSSRRGARTTGAPEDTD